MAVAAGAIGGAVGSIASQGVGIAIGAQEEFNWKGVALGAIGGGVSGGLGAIASGSVGALSGLSGPGLGVTMARAAIGSALTQGIGVATGLQDKFSWRSVAASTVGAGVGAVAGDALGMNDPGFRDLGFGEQLGKRLLTGLAAGAATTAMRGGRISATQVAVDAFGNALGDSLAAANGQQAQGVGPWSDADYRNGSDIQSDDAALQRQTQPYYDQIVGVFSQLGGTVDRSGDALLTDNWARDPSQNRVLSDAGAGRGRAIDVLRVDSQSPTFRVEVSGVGTPDEYNAAQVRRAYEKGEDLRPTRANAERLELQRTTITEDEAYSLAAALAGPDAILSSGMSPGIASGAGNPIVRSIAESASDAIIDYRLGPRTMGAVGTLISGYGVAAGYATGNPLLAGVSLDQMYANAKAHGVWRAAADLREPGVAGHVGTDAQPSCDR